MEPKEKAEELINKFFDYSDTNIENVSYFYCAKQSALILCEEMISTITKIDNAIISITTKIGCEPSSQLQYWKEVENEIKKT